MKSLKRMSERICCGFVLLTILFSAGSALASDLLRILPIKHDCGILEEGVPAIMQSILENISGHEVIVGSVKTN